MKNILILLWVFIIYPDHVILSELIGTPLCSAITCFSGNLCVYCNYTIWLITAIMPLSGWILSSEFHWLGGLSPSFYEVLCLKFGECRLEFCGVRFPSTSSDDFKVWGWIRCLHFLLLYQNVERRTDCSFLAPGTNTVLSCWMKPSCSEQGLTSVSFPGAKWLGWTDRLLNWNEKSVW